MQLKKFNIIFLFIFLIQSLNCQTKDVNIKPKIYSIVLDNVIKSYPPVAPPLAGGKTDSMSKKVDSANQKKLKVAIAKSFLFQKKAVNKKFIEVAYHGLIDDLLMEDNVGNGINEGDIYSKKGHLFTIVTNEIIKNDKKFFSEFDQLIYLSNIVFNPSRDKAVVYVGKKLSERLTGASLLYLLKKEDGKWMIEAIKEIEVS